MAVPDTNTFSLQDVKSEIESNGGVTTNSLVDAFANANISGFDPNYEGLKDRLLNFRNYNHITSSWEIADVTSNDTRDITAFKGGSSEAASASIHIPSSGTRMYVVYYSQKRIDQYSISIAHNINSTMTFVGSSPLLPYFFTGFQLNDTGTIAFTFDNTGTIRSYNLTKAWDITSMSTTVNASLSYPTSFSRMISFNRNGTKLYGVYSLSGNTYSVLWNLSTAYNLTTASTPITSNINSSISVITGCFYLEESGDDIFVPVGTSTPKAAAFRNGTTNSDLDSVSNNLVYVIPDCSNNSYVYQAERSGSVGNFTWTLKQYNTNI